MITAYLHMCHGKMIGMNLGRLPMILWDAHESTRDWVKSFAKGLTSMMYIIYIYIIYIYI